MSSRKDKFSSEDKYFMNIAINLAYNHKRFTGENPSVGCVIVKNNQILSFGTTSFFGRPHAEINALTTNKNTIGSTVYLTLEPCTHFGKTPPCTNALIKAKVKRVVYSIEDSDFRTSNKSKKILHKKKITVHSGLLKSKSKKLYNQYSYSKKNNLPYITAKLACSNDLKIFNNSNYISSKHSRNLSHILRAKNLGILTTYKTINIDNPKLDCRIDGLRKFSPVKIIIDRDLRIKKNSYILKNGNKTIIFHSSKNKIKLDYLKSIGVRTYFININQKNYLNILDIFKKLYQLSISSILIESGPKFLNEILNTNKVNEFFLFKSDIKIPKSKAIHVHNLIKIIKKKYKYSKNVNSYLDNDSLLHYY